MLLVLSIGGFLSSTDEIKDASTTCQPFVVEHIVIKNFKQFVEMPIFFSKGINILVGDNGTGKTTILEAIELALTGRYRGESINRCLSECLFNKSVVDDYIASIDNGDPEPPPEISVEVFLRGGDPHDLGSFQGDRNSTGVKASGFKLVIGLDKSYRHEYEVLLNEGSLHSLPIEYYTARFETFAYDVVTPRLLPIKAAVVNPSVDLYGFRAESRATRTLYDSLDDRCKVALAQGYRVALKSYRDSATVADINMQLASMNLVGDDRATLAVDSGTRDSWKGDLVVAVKDIPYPHIGSGMQCKLLSGVALSQSADKGVDLLLIEEPENHLSHTGLNSYLDFLRDKSESRQMIVSTHSSFVANKLGIDGVIMLGKEGQGTSLGFSALKKSTRDYFRRLPGYDTLRFVLCKVAVLVEGPSDELVFQRAYRDRYGKLPIEDGVDVISVGTSFKQFLPIADALGLSAAVITDNDGKPEVLQKRYESYADKDNIKVCFDRVKYEPAENEDPKLRWNTLEPTLLRANSREELNEVFGKSYGTDSELISWMEDHKTEYALILFDSPLSIEYPDYISEALDFVRSCLGK